MEEYRQWLGKANDDLNWTQKNIESGIFYGACFAAQQAAEKALKAFLIFNNQPFRKVHDVVALLEDCISIDTDFEDLRKLAELLFPYYVETRYPIEDTLVSFDKQKAKDAYSSAEKVVKFVSEKID